VKPVCLIVMDGWGMNPDAAGNATAIARTLNLSRIRGEYPATTIDTSGFSVGLPNGQMGNSEVGHLTLGAGRVIYQELTRIGKSIESGEFFRNPVLNGLLDDVRKKGTSLHLMGLLSDGGVHSHISHLFAILEAAQKKGISRVYIHAFLDGRDTPPSSGKGYMETLVKRLNSAGAGVVATVSGRYYAMDRDNRWDRIKKAYDAMVKGIGSKAKDPVEAVEAAYRNGETDEFVTPTVIVDDSGAPKTIKDGDGVIFFNFRSDRARELTKAFIVGDFDGFDRGERVKLACFACMTEYDRSFNLPVLFKPQGLVNILAEILSANNLRQFRVSETEKYAHVTFFFNGGREEPYPGEDRVLIPSVKDVPTYDKKPEMRAIEIASAAVEKINAGGYSFILMNFANGDMVGHTGVLDAAVKACETVDRAVGMVADAALKRGWAVIITSDHGNAEMMIDKTTNSPHTAHTTTPVPFILADNDEKWIKLRTGGGLQDVAPTVLKIMGIEKPAEMTGKPLF
jgi:2,3-bisphosphoglycerate-independent phosphoglycerate mutase